MTDNETTIKGPSAPARTKTPTITLSFADEDDQTLYEAIVSDAKADRRSVSQFLLIWLSAHYAEVE
jgi:hypothetical protein